MLPVGQPDGGRDAFVRGYFYGGQKSRRGARELIVFQVKYVKNTSDRRSEREMIEEVVKSERTKIETLKASGLSKYYLITNLQGTAHPGGGSIDRVDALLTEILGVEAYCWWRDDIDRRLDNNANIKWSYPEILKATDLLRALVTGRLGEEEERRRGAIRAYMIAQYEDERELRFKQTDLRSTISELFVDLPMRRSFDADDIETGGTSRSASQFSEGRFGRVFYDARYGYLAYGETARRSAEYFIQATPGELSRILLEGAPGQGKSTVTQYICQVMRMRLLDKHDQHAQLPPEFKGAPLRIPFRVDLRDFAKWIAGIDPFQSKPVDLHEREARSLEGFLAGQVRFTSGGHDFNVSDLTAVARASHILLALDGFDEVADVKLRERLVAEITKASARLMSAGGFSVRTVVTSRPAAFAKSIRFPRDQWTYFELLPLERQQVEAYTAKWMKAKGIKEAEQHQLSRILDAKLREPHTQYLAKNPMQLTILLSLIHNRGASLPEKRTAMYDTYMDLFFSREAEKSDIVRDNRDLLIDIHRFLAWKLQTAAEGGENGSIEHGALRRTLLLYLDSQSEDTSIVEELFGGIIERVGALVSRVQETYEFEVQPLREYFAARHLYETAPYSPAGAERTGTKLDRFDALVRNPYWLNVARFYGGCFNKGEIAALVDECIELAGSDPYRLTSHPRSLALMLLGDWVFTQSQPAVKKIVSFIADRPHLRQLLANAEQAGSSGWSALPYRSGRVEFLDILWSRLVEAKHRDERGALASAINQNSSGAERVSRWLSVQNAVPCKEWAELGSVLHIYHAFEFSLSMPSTSTIVYNLIPNLLDAGQFDYLENSMHFDASIRALLHNHAPHLRLEKQPSQSKLAALAQICSSHQYGFALHDESAAPVGAVWERRFALAQFGQLQGIGNLSETERSAIDAYNRFLDTPTTSTSASLEPWNNLVTKLRLAWGDCPAFDRIAFIGAGVRSKEANGDERPLRNAPDLVSAARYVRLKSGAPRWWERRLKGEVDNNERMRLLLLLWIWGTPKTIVKLSGVLGKILNSLSDTEWAELCRDYKSIRQGLWLQESPVIVGSGDIGKITKSGPRLCMFIGFRTSLQSRVELSEAAANSSNGPSLLEVQFAMDSVLAFCQQSRKWETGLPLIKSLYLRGASARQTSVRDESTLPSKIAAQISEDLENYPLTLIAIADSSLRSAAGASAKKLLDVATDEGWFPQ